MDKQSNILEFLVIDRKKYDEMISTSAPVSMFAASVCANVGVYQNRVWKCLATNNVIIQCENCLRNNMYKNESW